MDSNDEAPVQHHTIAIVLVGDSEATKTRLGLIAIKPLSLLFVCGYCSKDSLKMSLNQRDVKVTSFPPVFCSNGHLQERDTIIQMLSVGKEFLFCIECGQKTRLPAFDLLRLSSI